MKRTRQTPHQPGPDDILQAAVLTSYVEPRLAQALMLIDPRHGAAYRVASWRVVEIHAELATALAAVCRASNALIENVELIPPATTRNPPKSGAKTGGQR